MKLLVKNLVFTFVVPGSVAVYIPVYVINHAQFKISNASIIGFILLLTGGFIYAWCVWDFATKGRGTPAPIDAPKTLVVHGLYKYSRNPMYIGVLFIILAWVLIFYSLNIAIYGMFVTLCFHLFIVVYEEPHLKHVFGESYEQYCSEVSRWI